MSYKPIPTLDSNNATFIGNINACTNILSGGTDIADIFATSASIVDGSGTAGKLSKWSDSNTLTDSLVSESGTQVVVGGDVCFANGDGIRFGTGTSKISRPSDGCMLFNLSDNSGKMHFRAAGATDTGFRFCNGASTPTESMRIEHNGNVGIGTTSPSVNFQVGDGTTDTSSRFYHNDNTYTEVNGYGLYMSRYISYIRPTTDNGKNLYIGTQDKQWLTVSQDASTHAFLTNGSESVRINSSGNVGIGTSTPTAKLTLSGSGDSIPMLEISNATNGGGAAIHFSDNAAGGMAGQTGGLVYCHQDSKSQGGAASFTLSSSESDLAIIAGTASKTARHVVKSANSVGEVDYGFYDDINTGLYQAANNAAGLVSNGSEKLRVNSNGVQLCDELFVPTNIVHTGDTNTCIGFADDNINLIAGGENGITVNTSGVVVNQDGNANDFRVEGDTNISLLHAKGGTDRVGIRCGAPGYELDVNGSINTTSNLLSSGVNLDTLFLTEGCQGTVTSVTAGDGLCVENSTTTPSLSVDSTVVRTSGAQSIAGAKCFTDNVRVAANIYHTGDTDTRINFNTNNIKIEAGGESQIVLNTSEVVINDLGASNDFRVEGDTDTHALFVDGSADKVGIGCSSPTQKLAVAGDGLFTSDLTVQGSLSVLGDFTCLETTVSLTSAMDITNHGTGPALLVNQTGSNDIVNFQDDGTSVFYIEDGGFVGLGTTNPSSLLHLESASSPSLQLKDTTQGTTLKAFSQDSNAHLGTFSNHPLVFDTNSGERMRILTNGNVGIGDSSPGHKLDVGGNINATGSYKLDDSDVINSAYRFVGSGISLADNETATFGNGNDLRLQHNGTNSYIQNFTGDLRIEQYQDDGDIIFSSDDGAGGLATYMRIDGGSSNVQFFKDAFFTDNKYINIGSGFDLRLFHDTNNSYIQTQGTGNLIIQQTVDDGDIIFKSDNGSGGITEYFRLDGSTEQNVVSKNMRFEDNIQAQFGAGTDLRIYHDGSNSYIQDSGTGSLYTQTNAFRLLNAAGTENMICAVEDGAVNLYYNNVNQLQTTAAGATVTGDLTVNGGDITLGGTGRIQGIDTVSAGTDAANKCYVDACIAAVPTGDITAVVAGAGLTGGATSGSATLDVGAGTAITVAADTVSVNSTCNSTWNAKTTCTGTVTSVATGNGISGGTITGSGTLTVGAGTGLTQTSTGLCINSTCNSTWNAKTTCTGTVTSVTGGDGLTGTVTSSGSLAVDSTVVRTSGAQTIADTKNFSGSICVGANIYHSGDANTSINFNTDIVCINAGGAEAVRFCSNSTTFNEGGNSNDFRVESDTNTHMLFVDGSANAIGINCSTPGATLAVNGSFTATCKSFLVDNPVTGGQLKYGVVEGNEHGVTVRGSTCCGTIELPEEWDWLVHEDSVTVQLTPVGSAHTPYVVCQNNNEVVVCTHGCYNYNIYGTRKDVEPLEVNIL